MATSSQTAAPKAGPSINLVAQSQVLKFVQGVLTSHKQNTDIFTKMDAIDVAYYRYRGSLEDATDGGVDVQSANRGCGNIFDDDDVVPPIVVSQVDSYVGHLASIFLSGTPLFPVVSMPADRKWAEQLETLLDDHAIIGGYARQLLMFLRDAVKYNYAACECEWTSINQFSVAGDFTAKDGKAVAKGAKKFTRIKRLDPRNVIRDTSVLPGDVAEFGDYAGHIEVISKTKLKTWLYRLQAEGRAMNVNKALDSGATIPAGDMLSNYRDPPQLSNYVASVRNSRRMGVDWDVWFDGQDKGSARSRTPYGTMYEKVTLYARIAPADFNIIAPAANTPQIWKLVVINGQHVVYAERIISAFDYLPILFGQPLEDGMGDQTQSVAEGEIPFQRGAGTLFNIRFAASRRAVNDRALYLAEMITPSDVNAKGPAPKIPVRISALSNKKLGDAYMQIPFDMRGTETTISDAQQMIAMSNQLHGLNNTQRGEFQKGNKSVTEFNTTMDNSEDRLRLPALALEHQFFTPMKSIMVLNVFQYGDNVIVVSQKTGEVINIDLTELRKHALAFKLADGYNPKSKIASTDVIVQGMQMIMQSQPLQAAYGASLPAMFAHMMSLGGVKGLEQYDPSYKGTQNMADPNLNGATLQELPAQSTPVALPGTAAVGPDGQPALPVAPDPLAGVAAGPQPTAPGIP